MPVLSLAVPGATPGATQPPAITRPLRTHSASRVPFPDPVAGWRLCRVQAQELRVGTGERCRYWGPQYCRRPCPACHGALFRALGCPVPLLRFLATPPEEQGLEPAPHLHPPPTELGGSGVLAALRQTSARVLWGWGSSSNPRLHALSLRLLGLPVPLARLSLCFLSSASQFSHQLGLVQPSFRGLSI